MQADFQEQTWKACWKHEEELTQREVLRIGREVALGLASRMPEISGIQFWETDLHDADLTSLTQWPLVGLVLIDTRLMDESIEPL